MIAPCKDCPDRRIGCHSDECKKWAEYALFKSARSDKRQKESAEKNEYMAMVMGRMYQIARKNRK